MTTADAIKVLECKLMAIAVKVVDNHDYGIECPNTFCRTASELFSLHVVNDNPDCEESLTQYINGFTEVPTDTDINTEEDCTLSVTNVTPQTDCPPLIITQL